MIRRFVPAVLRCAKRWKEEKKMENGFRGYHPFVMIFYYACAATLVLYVSHPVFLATALLLFIFVNMSHDRGKALKKWLVPLILMGTMFTLMNPLLVSRGTNILWYIGNRQITLEAVMYGFVMGLTLMAMVVLFVSFNLMLNGNKFLYVFAKLLPKTAFFVLLALRFVPLLHRRFREISDVQKVRGMSMLQGSISDRAKNGMNMLQTLLTWSLEAAIQTADSMKARGYGSGPKSSYDLYQMEKRDWFWLLLIMACFGICVFAGTLGYGKIVIYPELGTLRFYLLDWLLYVCMLMVLSFPLIVEGIEKARWTFYK